MFEQAKSASHPRPPLIQSIMPYQALPGFQEQATLRNFKYSSEYIRPQQDEASQALLFRHYEITLRVEYIQNSAKPGGSPTKNLLAACGIVLLFAVSSSCKNPAAPPPDTTPKSYISYSLNGNGTQTTYSDGVTSGSGIITRRYRTSRLPPYRQMLALRNYFFTPQ